MTKTPTNEQGQVDFARLMFENPLKALTLHGESVKAQMRQEYLEARAQDNWEQQFYRAYPHLSTALGRTVVWDILKSNFDGFKSMPVSESNAIIADQADKNIARLKKEEERHKEHAVFQGGPGFEGTSEPPPVDEDWSMGSGIKARAEARRCPASAPMRQIWLNEEGRISGSS